MTPVYALKLLPELVERKIHHLGELAAVEREIGEAIAAFGPQGWHYEQLVAALTRPEPAQVAAPAPAVAVLPQEDPHEWAGDVVARMMARLAPTAVEPEEPEIPVAPEPVDQLAAAAPEPAQPEAAAAPAEPEPAQAAPVAEIAQPPAPQRPAPDPARTAAEPTCDEDGWVSCKVYAAACGVSEPVIYNAIGKGVLDGDAVQAGPPKRVRPELADRQILERAPAGILRMNVAKRVERTVVLEAASEPAAMSLGEAVRILRGFGYQVLELEGELFDVNGARLGPGRVVEKATSLKSREERLAAARRSAA
jgi:hypothetical protein